MNEGESAVARRVLERLDLLLERLGAAYRVVPEYAALPQGVIESEVLPVSREIIAGFLHATSEGRAAAVDDVAVLDAMGRRRLEMGVPLEPMLHVYRIAGREVFDEIAAATGPSEKAELALLGRAWMDYIDQASSVAASGYLQASHERLRRIDAHRGALLESLLAAVDTSDVAAVAAEFAVTLAPCYAVVLIAGPEVATLVDRITASSPPGSLSGFRGSQVVVLAPDEVPDLEPLARVVPLGSIAHGHPAEPGAALAAELRRTELLLAAAVRRGTPGVFGPDDLLVDQLLATSSEVASALVRRVVEPLRAADRDGMVEATLRTYLRTGSIPTTAAAEIVHANTVAYRLRRVAERVALDARVPEQATILSLALAAADLAASPPPREL